MKKKTKTYGFIDVLTSLQLNVFAIVWFVLFVLLLLAIITQDHLKELIYVASMMLVTAVTNEESETIDTKNLKTSKIQEGGIEMETARIKNGDIVRHFKKETCDNKDPNTYLYKVIDTNAREVDNYKKVVVYEALYDNGDIVHHGNVFVRKYDEFMSEVDHVKYPDIKQKYRFEVV